jgi:Zn-finger nucleic acid-binding protein
MTNERRCIKCETAMTPKMVEDVEIDYCPECRGVWLDRDEIRELADKSDEALGELRELVQEGAPAAPARSSVDRPCPACAGKLTLAVFGSIYMEHCTLCEGIYLDRGELDKAMFVVKARGDEIATIVALARSVVTRGTIGS